MRFETALLNSFSAAKRSAHKPQNLGYREFWVGMTQRTFYNTPFLKPKYLYDLIPENGRFLRMGYNLSTLEKSL